MRVNEAKAVCQDRSNTIPMENRFEVDVRMYVYAWLLRNSPKRCGLVSHRCHHVYTNVG